MTALFFNYRVQHEYVTYISPATIGSVTQIINYNYASADLVFVTLGTTILCVVFDTVLLLFALCAFVRHAFQAKALDGRWSMNVLVRTLVADHLVYFVVNLTWMLLSLAENYAAEELNDVLYVFGALAIVAGPRMVISLRATEYKTRGEGGTLEGDLSTVRFGIREPPIQSESAMEEGGGFPVTDEHCE
ncbi:hypothetical protein BJ138DRAFT_1120141 [Hygrophoropsis aurantiaca]|uniref:Uncharacterized protein n=1 Tax=Hygrophoropsis aurantiaca TaxID=72124 RepID=A0ACB7ZSD2_9AGAM|nr:hypothetical protein BJ138DRAFT_1120141 [Hygrophoropsis aurantiaca]